MIKTLGYNICISKTPGYFLSEAGVIDTNLQYIGYIVHNRDILQVDKKYFPEYYDIGEKECLIKFHVDWQGEFFECVTPTHNIALVYNNYHKLKNNQIKYNLHNYDYLNSDDYILKVPNNVYVLWHDNLINQYDIVCIYFFIKTLSLPELSFIICHTLLELIRTNYNNYKIIDNIVTPEAKSLAYHSFRVNL